MEFIDTNGEVRITGVTDFDLSKTFECGQCFRWSVDDRGIFSGIAHGKAVTVRQDGDAVCISGTIDDFNDVWRGYFDLDRDYANIRAQLCISEFMRRATDFGAGIRILRQEPWETLCTFILSQRNNIPKIKKNVSILCREFGEPIIFNGKTLYTFPTAERLSTLSETDLAPIRAGYRANYIITAAKTVAGKTLDFNTLVTLPVGEARTELKKIHGVGNKVADCVILFGLHMLDSFPIDTWIEKALVQHFPPTFDPSCFSPYAGIAQQYIFYFMRNKKACN